MRRRYLVTILCVALGCGGTPALPSDDLAAPSGDMAGAANDQAGSVSDGAATGMMTFFISSRTGSANLGGLAGADKICQDLAVAVGAGQRTWAAYLSVSSPAPVSARDRIGAGPWRNAAGVQVAASVADLHSPSNNIAKATGLDEKGAQVPGRGDTPNQHDILTGSVSDGTPSAADCAGWTSDTTGTATLGHFDRVGGGADPSSWNSAHASQGCSAQSLVNTGGAGRIYCFATN